MNKSIRYAYISKSRFDDRVELVSIRKENVVKLLSQRRQHMVLRIEDDNETVSFDQHWVSGIDANISPSMIECKSFLTQREALEYVLSQAFSVLGKTDIQSKLTGEPIDYVYDQDSEKGCYVYMIPANGSYY